MIIQLALSLVSYLVYLVCASALHCPLEYGYVYCVELLMLLGGRTSDQSMPL